MRITRQKVNVLRSSDIILAEVIDKVGLLQSLDNDSNHLKNACKIIVDQQISFKAARAIWNRLDQLVVDWNPVRIDEIDISDIREAGLSSQKVNYIKSLASSLNDNVFTFDHMTQLNNEEVILELIKIKGFGRWSAAMFLIFSLGREDVFAAEDGGLKRAVINIYDLDENSYPQRIEAISEKWAPYKTIASLYLWAWHDVI